MNNLQPLNLLTTSSGSPGNEGGESSGQTFSNPTSVDHQTRQMALASLFSSLSNLANQQQQQRQIQPPPRIATNQIHPFFSQSNQPTTRQTNSISPPQVSNQSLLGNQINQQPAFTPTTSCPQLSLTSSFQSVVAAAMMQQQLAASAAASKQQAPSPTNVFLPGAINPRLDQMDAQIAANASHLYSQQQSQQQQTQQQRINYCTICNKELCNKYFMKTHMLKMHGINLEMEQPEGGSDADSNDGPESEEDDQNAQDNNNERKVQVKEEITDGNSPGNHTADWSDQASGRKKPPGGKKSSTPKKVDNNSSAASNTQQQSQKQATSVMNGFAGNSMGGVVCDICNKELCSKYFLKVHKQNTHGIMTDYQDPNQFIYPFAGPAANPFQPPTIGQPGLIGPGAMSFPPNPFAGLFNPQQQPPQSLEPPSPTKKPTKRARVAGGGKSDNNIDQGSSETESELSANKQQLESVYRLLLAKQQQPLAGPHCAMTQQPQFDPAAMNAAVNPLASLMCFGAMGPAVGPFGPAPGMSAAMVVDNILRNQHLFNRANNNVNQTNKPGQNNQDTKQSGKNGGKDSTNNRYFSHYTEACPMCDRRFKSIKWLKTHMMNDHKQEIGAYMQMMMQYMYTGKSQQQMMLEQQQQQQMAQHLIANNSQSSLINKLNTYQAPPQTLASSLLASQADLHQQLANNSSNNPFQSNYHQSRLPVFTSASSTSPAPPSYDSKQLLAPATCLRESASHEFAGGPIDARCIGGRESLSPCGQSASPLSRSPLASAATFTGLSCLDLERLSDSNNNNSTRDNCYLLGNERIRDSPPPWDEDDDLNPNTVTKHQDVEPLSNPGRHQQQQQQQPQIKSSE